MNQQVGAVASGRVHADPAIGDIEVPDGSEIVVTVSDASSQAVVASYKTTTTGGDGSFSVPIGSDLLPGGYSVIADFEGQGNFGYSQSAEVELTVLESLATTTSVHAPAAGPRRADPGPRVGGLVRSRDRSA